MKISGELVDAGVAEVLQVIHFGGRSGTLRIESEERRAELSFHRGKMVRAWATGAPRLGEVLVERGAVSPETLDRALSLQQREDVTRSLGRVLHEEGLVASLALQEAVEEQIERAVLTVVSWRQGSFDFAIEQLIPVEETARYPGDIVPELRFDTQKLLLEAFRRLDETDRPPAHPVAEASAPEPSDRDDPASAERPAASSETDFRLAGLALGFDPPAATSGITRAQLVTPDPDLRAALAALLGHENLQIVEVPLRAAGVGLPGEPAPLVVVDLRAGGFGIEDLRELVQRRPRIVAVSIVDRPELTASAYHAGAVAALPGDPEALAACLHRFVHPPPMTLAGDDAGERQAVGRLRRVLGDLRSGLFSATMSLSLMSIVAESAERAVLFLVRQRDFTVLGAFGFAEAQGRPLADATRRLTLPQADAPCFRQAISEGQARRVHFAAGDVPAALAERIGPPRIGHGALIPVLGRDHVVALIYADNGTLAVAMQDLELLEVATAQVGLAFENELLRRQLDRRDSASPAAASA